MRILSLITILATVGLAGLNNESQAQTVQDNNSAEAYFDNAARVLCGARARVSVSANSASVFLYGEYLQNRNLDEVARNLALDGLNAFPDSPSFYVFVKDSKGQGYAEVKR